ncbi:type I DNA topoisomerase, partial [Candidatus Curtissbacteria bacterium]|nr:type I DNA topoisomerase [Candidatus Curtissbacteria bacterium]
RFLGSDFEVIASMGHIYDLPKSKLGVDTENNFDPQYELMMDKKKTLDQLKRASKGAERIIMATDLDREGEAIAYHIANAIRENQKSKIKNQKLERIVFHEITREAIEDALKNPREVDRNLVDAQTARRVLDRLVGYKLSPLLWSKVRRGLSAGRVQSVALRLIVEREREIEKFVKEPYFTITVELSRGPVSLHPHPTSSPASQSAGARRGSPALATPSTTSFELIEIDGEKIEETRKLELYDGEYKFVKTSINTEEKAKKIENDLKTKEFIVADVAKKEMRRSPPPPYTTSTLQQDGARRMGLSGKRTMMLAQKLYEEGFITYHRTDSFQISDQARKQMSDYVRKEFGDKYLSPKPRFYRNTSINAQEAHEAIRPTSVGQIANSKLQIANSLGAQHARLYEMIWRRAVATMMSDAIIESTSVLVDARSSFSVSRRVSSNDGRQTIRAAKTSDAADYRLKTNGSVLLFEGFLKINPYALEDKRLPEFVANEKLDYVSSLAEAHETLPPPRYNDASIIKTLEEKGIGRPSTYATIISTIESRGYIEREEGKFHPTAVGFAVNDFLVDNFSAVDDIPFTAEMEDEMDQIASGEKKWVPVIAEFYTPFEKTLNKVKDAKRVKIAVEETDEKCPKCGEGKLVIRSGRFGKFLSCNRFPECKFTKPLVHETNLICPKCGRRPGEASGPEGGKIVIKKTKKGRKFYGCSNYPACDFAAWRLEDIKDKSNIKN